MTAFEVEISTRLAEALAALDNVAELAENGRLTVSAIGEAKRQIDVDSASALTRGHFLTIAAFSKTVASRIRSSVKGTYEN